MMTTIDFLEDKTLDSVIRTILHKGNLEQIAKNTGIAGGVSELQRLRGSKEPLHIMDRGMLALHLGLLV